MTSIQRGQISRAARLADRLIRVGFGFNIHRQGCQNAAPAGSRRITIRHDGVLRTHTTHDYYSFWKPEVSEKFGTYLYIMGLRSGPLRVADLTSAYSLGKFNSLSNLQLHAARSN
jgi:hypothetical protein